MLKQRLTTKLKLNWLAKNKYKYINKINNAFRTVRRELIEFLNDYQGDVDVLIKYLVKCVETDDAMTFIQLIKSVIEEANKCDGDSDAFHAKIICSYILFRVYWLSAFTIQWTNVRLKCSHCGCLVEDNYCFSNKLCPYCGSILL